MRGNGAKRVFLVALAACFALLCVLFARRSVDGWMAIEREYPRSNMALSLSRGKGGVIRIVQLMGRENLGRGVRIQAPDDSVTVDLFIIVEYGISISAVASTIIDQVKYKIEHLTGVTVERVNVSIEDIRV